MTSTIHMPSAEFIGLLADALLFAAEDPEILPDYGVRLSSDGEMLHCQATDRYHAAWVQWHPHDAPPEDVQPQMSGWSVDGDPFAMTLHAADVKDLIRNFGLPAKRGWTPVRLDIQDGTLRVIRLKDKGCSGLEQSVDGAADELPDLAGEFAKLDQMVPMLCVTLAPDRMARFGKVRPRGVLSMTCTGETGPVLFTIGARFTAAIQQAREADGSAK